jgi:hypothetical protein
MQPVLIFIVFFLTGGMGIYLFSVTPNAASLTFHGFIIMFIAFCQLAMISGHKLAITHRGHKEFSNALIWLWCVFPILINVLYFPPSYKVVLESFFLGIGCLVAHHAFVQQELCFSKVDSLNLEERTMSKPDLDK